MKHITNSNLREKAYKELKKAGCNFGYFYIIGTNRKGRKYITKTKRNTLKARDVFKFPENDNQLKKWIDGSAKIPLNDILKRINIIDINGDTQIITEPYNTLIEINTKKIVVFDCDVKNGKDGYKVLKNLFKDAFKFVANEEDIDPEKFFTCINRTPNNGYHIYFKVPKGKTPFWHFDFAEWGQEYAGLEIKKGLMFSGVSIDVKYEKHTIPGTYHDPEQIVTTINAKIEGTYQLDKWEGLQELPIEVYEYLEYLNKKNAKISLSRKKIKFSGRLKENSDKLYQNILNGTVYAGSRFLALQSLAGYLVLTCRTYHEAKEKFIELANKNTSPPYPKDSPSEWKQLLKFLQDIWELNYESINSVNPKFNTSASNGFLLVEPEDYANLMTELATTGLHFIHDEITDNYQIKSEEMDVKLIVGEELSSKMKSVLRHHLLKRLGKLASSEDMQDLIFLGQKFYTKHNRIAEYFDAIEPYEDTSLICDFFHAFVSNEYPPALKEQIIFYLIKWFVIMYQNALAKEGARNSAMLILTGPQQVGKGFFIDNLFPQDLKFSVQSFNIKDYNREFKFNQISRCLIHWDDAIQNFTLKEWEGIKGIISAPSINWNPKYKNYTIDKPQRASHVATTNDEYFLMDTQNKRYFPVKVQEYDIKRYYVKPRLFLGIIKHLAEKVYPDWLSWNSHEQKFFDQLSKKHIKNTEVIEALFEYFDFINASSKKEAVRLFYNQYGDRAGEKKLMFATITMLRTFLINVAKITPASGEIKNSLHKLGYKIVKNRINGNILRGYYIVPKSYEPLSYIPNRNIIEGS